MKKAYKKSKGSSLMIVLVVFSILSVLGMAILPLTVSGYKQRIMEGDLKHNLYASESGLDIAYGVIGKEVETAIEDGNTGAKDYVTALDLENQKMLFTMGTTPNSFEMGQPLRGAIETKVVDGISKETINEENLKNIIAEKQEEKFKEKFQQHFTKSDTNNILVKLKNISVDTAESKLEIQIKKENTNEDVIRTDLSFVEEDGNSILHIPPITSRFLQKGLPRTVTVAFDIKAPKYKDVYSYSSNVVNFPRNAVWYQKAICADGDVNIKGSTVTIEGNVYVGGTDAGGSDSIETNGGITVNGATSLTVTGHVAVDQNLQTQGSESNVTVNGNVYAHNVTIKENSSEVANSSIITAKGGSPIDEADGSIFTMNDLTLNGKQAVVDIKGGFFGFNDGEHATEPDQSSSIKINSKDLGSGSRLSIGEKSIIKGVAWIDTKIGKYQTGEAISVKGNYKAYSFPLLAETQTSDTKYPEYLSTGLTGSVVQNTNMKYFDPLTLVSNFKTTSTRTTINPDTKQEEKTNVPLELDDKADYFFAYYNQYKSNSGLEFGGTDSITLPSVEHVGAIVGNGELKHQRLLSVDAEKDILKKQREHNTMVYQMGQNIPELTDSLLEGLTGPTKTVGKTNPQIDFAKIGELSADKKEENITNNEKKLLDGSAADKQKLLDGTFIVVNDDEGKKYALGADISKAPSGSIQITNMNGILITKGDVCICDGVKFKGTIITAGKIEFVGSGEKEVIYNGSFVERLIAQNYERIFKGIIKDEGIEKASVEIDNSYGTAAVQTSIVRDKLVNYKNWTVIR